MSETRQLADFIATLDAAACPAAALALAKRCIAETIGCSLGGARTPPMAAAMRAARRQGEGGPATVLGQGWRTAPDRAAFLNALAANALDYDGGIIRQGHYGSTVVSAALAVGELLQSPGSQILSAVVAGYEVVTRVGEALCASVERHALVSGYGPYQGFGAAAATGHLLGLDPERMVYALGLCGAFAPVPATKGSNWADRPLSWTKDMVAWPARVGVEAALLAEAGYIGPRTIFEGDRGFWRMAGSDRYDPRQLVAGLGEEFRFQDMYFKPYPCCRWNHAALDGVRAVMARQGWTAEDVAGIQLGVAKEVLGDQDNHDPHNLVDAQFSLPYVATMVLLGVEPGPRWYDPELLTAPRVRELMAKVTLHLDADMEELFEGRSVAGAKVQVTGRDGRRDQALVEIAYGHALNPMTDADLAAKFLGQAAEALAPAAARAALDRILDLEHLDRAASLTALLLGN
ncbi:MAG: MmgE/PrpD family protein [Holophaga sp.]|jgi:2-methylcitrate dehydratase PrpD